MNFCITEVVVADSSKDMVGTAAEGTVVAEVDKLKS